MRTGFLLSNPLPQHIFDVAFPQCLLESGFAGRVDPFSDDNRAVDCNRPAIGGNHGAVFRLDGLRPDSRAMPGHRRNMIRRGAAAAPDPPGAHPSEFFHRSGKRFRVCVEYGTSVHTVRQSSVGIHHHRQRGTGEHFLKQPFHLLGPHSTVDPQGIYPQSFQKSYGGGNIPSSKEPPPGIEDHCGDHRQRSVFLCRENRRFEFIRVVHRFDQHEIGAGGLPRLCHLGKKGIGGLKRQIPERLEQSAGGADIQRDFGHSSAFRHRLCGEANALFHQIRSGIASAFAFLRIGTESIGCDNVTARL